MNILNNRNKRTNIFKAVALCLIAAVSFTLVSCDDDMDIQQSYPFTVAAYRPLEKWQTVDCRLPVRPLLAADPCRHGTDRQKRTEHYHEYTHHFSKGLKLPMGTMVKPSSFTFRLLKSNSNSKKLPKLSSTTTMKLCASSPSAM